MRRNTTFLKGLCLVLPTALLAAAHYFPWRRLRHRDLHVLEAYAIGTAAIVGTAGFAIAISDGDKDDHVVMLGLAAASAGLTTLSAHAIDDRMKQNGKIVELEARLGALQNNGNV